MDTTVVCDAGPDAGASVVVGAASVIVGRSPTADLTIRDAAAELHHLLVEPGDDGTVRVTQLSGRTVARVGDRPVGPATPVAAGGVITFGASRLRVGRLRRSPEAPPASSRTAGVAELVDPSASPPLRTADDGTMFRVHVGVTEAGASVITDLEPATVVQLTGSGAAGVARSFVVQLAALVPTDRVALTLSGATGWLPDGVHLPHLKDPAAGEHHVVFVADPTAGSLDMPALRARLGVRADAAVVILDDRAHAASPNLPGARLCLGALGRGRWAPGADVTGSQHVHAAAVTTETVVRFAARLDGRPRPPVGTSWTAPVEQLAGDRPVDTIDVVGAWRRATGRPALWLGRDGNTACWVQLGGPVVVVGNDPARRLEVLTTYAAALALEHGPTTLGLVLGEGVGALGPTHVVGAPLTPARIGHELARPQPSRGRSTVVVADDPFGEAATAQLARGIDETIAGAAAGGRALIVGLAPDHPWAATLLDDPAVTTVVCGIEDLAVARRIADSRATRLMPGRVMIRTPGRPFRVATLPELDERARRSLVGVLAHADALTATPGARAVRSCGPCPDDDSPWARPSSDPSSATMLVPVSSAG